MYHLYGAVLKSAYYIVFFSPFDPPYLYSFMYSQTPCAHFLHDGCLQLVVPDLTAGLKQGVLVNQRGVKPMHCAKIFRRKLRLPPQTHPAENFNPSCFAALIAIAFAYLGKLPLAGSKQFPWSLCTLSVYFENLPSSPAARARPL